MAHEKEQTETPEEHAKRQAEMDQENKERYQRMKDEEAYEREHRVKGPGTGNPGGGKGV